MNTALDTRTVPPTAAIAAEDCAAAIDPTLCAAAGAAWVAAISRIGVQDRAFAPMHLFTPEVEAFGAVAYVNNMPLVTANPEHVVSLDATTLRRTLTDIAVAARAREERNWARSRAAQVAAERAA